MEIRVHSLKFNADQKLLDFVEKKVSKLSRFDEAITDVEVVLSLMELSLIHISEPTRRH